MRGKTEDTKSIEEEKDLIISLFKTILPKYGEILLPEDNFYNGWDSSGNSLRLMACKIFDWLNCDPNSLIIDFYDKMQPPGVFIHDENKKCILINSKHSHNPFECGAILAHEIMHYYLMEKCKITLDDTLANELLTDLGTIHSGLGILVLNSFNHESNWHITTILLMFGQLYTRNEKLSFGYFDPYDYGKQFKSFLDKFEIENQKIYGYIVPKAKIFLPPEFRTIQSKNKSGYVITAEKTESKETKWRIIMVIIIIPIALLFWHWRNGGFNTTKTIDGLTPTEKSELQKTQQSADKIKYNFEDCKKKLAGEESELNDIETKMSISKNSNNTTEYNILIPKQNSLVNEYNNKRDECTKLQDDYNNKVNEYNNLIKK